MTIPTASELFGEDKAPADRIVHLTQASLIRPRPVHWLWNMRAALGTLVLIAGREGIGKSICAYTLFAMLTRGKLEGDCQGRPRAVIVAATEDSWEHTIVPRLMAAGADLDMVYRVDVKTHDDLDTGLLLPKDLDGLEDAIRKVDAVALLMDPLLSRLDAGLDTHKDAEVRRALEPLVKLADKTNVCVLGLIHVNKSASADALNTVMGSRAFSAVARAVLFVMTDPEDEHTRLLGQAKNNLGRLDLPTLRFRINGNKVMESAAGPVWTGRLEWIGETARSIKEALEAASELGGDKTATSEAADWLSDYLTDKGGMCDSAILKKDGARAGHSVDALKRARRSLQIVTVSRGFPRHTYWGLPGQSEQPVGASQQETLNTALTALTGDVRPDLSQLVQSEQSGKTPWTSAPTGLDGSAFVFDPTGAFGRSEA